MALRRLASLGLLLLVTVTVTLSSRASAAEMKKSSGGHKYGEWEGAHATFYGGQNAQGTMGGACGYGNLYNTGYGTQTAAASGAIWYDGKACGGCYEIMCVNSKYCKPGARTRVTVTNRCPYGSAGGWCDYGKKHLDMAMPAWLNIGSSSKAGVLPTVMRRVPCKRSGGIKFQVSGNPFFLMLMIYNVGGPGDLAKVEVQSGSGSWRQLSHNWGAIYSGSSPGNSRSVNIRLTTATAGRQVICWGALPKGYWMGNTYQSTCQFTY